MDWQTFAATFGAIFLAEMGDKTQLAAVTMAAQSGKPWAVLAGASVAMIGASAIGVIAGAALGTTLPVDWVKRAAAFVFIAIGALILAGKL
jgi:putative Ca2+/H+ antiporter (TMEM165/GDT1 family)